MIALTYDEVKALDPSSDSFSRVSRLLGGKTGWNGNRIDAASARETGCTFNDLVWVGFAIARKNADAERRLRLWMADCAAHVLNFYEKTEKSDAPRKAIIAARQFARGEINERASAAAINASRAAASAAWSASRVASSAVSASSAAAWAASAASAAASTASRVASRAAAWAASRAASSAVSVAASAAEEAWQFDRLVLWFSDNEPDDLPLPERA